METARQLLLWRFFVVEKTVKNCKERGNEYHAETEANKMLRVNG
jgi:hypothetical protein